MEKIIMNIIEVIKDVTTIGALVSIIGIFYYNFCGFGRSLVNTYELSGLSSTDFFQVHGYGFVNHYHFSLKVGTYGLHLFSLLYFGKYLLKHRVFSDIENLDTVFNKFTKKQIAKTKRLFFCWILFILSCISISIFF